MWFLQIIRSFFFSLDNVLFNFIPTVYDLLITISRTTILSQGQIKAFADRIQMLLGVFMIFKVAFSLITYIINPDEFSDKSKGFGKLWQNIIISLILLVLTPYAFDLAYKAQGMILEDNTLATLILGRSEDDPKNNYLNTAGQQMAYTIMLPFFLPDTSNSSLSDCSSLINEAGDANEECFNAMYNVLHPNDSDTDPLIENYKLGVENGSLGLVFRLDIAKIEIQNNTADSNGNTNSGFLINYMAPLSTVVAVVVLLLLITFCMDVALRSVKLAFLQLISPIPIISFIDPKSGKDGMFKKWYQMCFQTYISLFVRFIALYFGIYIISKIGAMYDIVNGSRVDDFWVKIFVIIGVLMFIKQLPKILEGFGFKLDGDGKFQLNPFKKLEEQAVGGKRITGAAAGLAAGTVGAFTGAGIGKGISGAVGGFVGGKGFAEGLKSASSKNSILRSLNRIDRNPFSRTAGRLSAAVSSTIGAPTRSEQIESRVSQIDNQIKSIDSRIKPMNDSISDRKSYADKIKSMEDRAVSKIKNGEAGKISENYKMLEARAERLREQMRKGVKGVSEATVAQAEMAVNDYLNNMGKEDYINSVIKAPSFNGAREYKKYGASLAADTSYSQSDPAMIGQYNDLKTMVGTTSTTYTHDGGSVTVDSSALEDAATMHSNSGQVMGSITYDTRNTINPASAEKQSLEQEKARLYDEQNRYKSYQDAVKK